MTIQEKAAQGLDFHSKVNGGGGGGGGFAVNGCPRMVILCCVKRIGVGGGGGGQVDNHYLRNRMENELVMLHSWLERFLYTEMQLIILKRA